MTGNETLRSLHGLWRIWFEISATPQYYPLVHTTFWLEYHLWGLNPLGFHFINVLLHGAAAILLWRVLLRLHLPGAWLAAAIFALHPVHVESVAWITERKNVLSALFYFASGLAYLRFHGNEGRKWYFIALVCFVCALFSKSVSCSLPAALLLIFWWKNGRVERKDVSLLLPFFALGICLGLTTAWLEKTHVGAEGGEWSLNILQRCIIAGRALWFYIGKLIWPTPLTFIYPHWEINPEQAWQWLFLFSALAVVIVLWLARRRIGRGPLVAFLFFAGTLAPALGFINVYPFRYSFVADHFQYIASVGLIALGAVGLSRIPRVFSGALLLVLAALTFRQAEIYKDLETLWRDTVSKNPNCWLAHNNLAYLILQKGEVNDAITHYRKALEIHSDYPDAYNNLGNALVKKGQLDEAVTNYEKALKIFPNFSEAENNLANALFKMGNIDTAISHYRNAVGIKPDYVHAHINLGTALMQKGRLEEAGVEFEAALRLRPDFEGAYGNLVQIAWELATNPDARLRNGKKAIEFALDAKRISSGNDPKVPMTLAAAYAETKQFTEAIAAAQTALQLSDAQSNSYLSGAIKAQLERYNAGQSLR